jgi:hypothetical protein
MAPRQLSRRGVFAAAAAVTASVIVPACAQPGRSDPASAPEPASRPAELARRCTIGAWAAGDGELAANHVALEDLVGARLPLVSWFADWDTGWDGGLARGAAALARRGDYELMISWEPVGVTFADVLDGAHDEYLVAFLDAAGRHPGRVLLRPFAEMNGPWQPWSVEHRAGLVGEVASWTAAWRHVVDLGRERAPNVSFVFCANTTDEGRVPMEDYWPGAEWVDLVGIDGYNWGFTADGRPQAGPEQVIGPMYRRLTALHPDAEVVVCETGCAEGEGKAGWTEALYTAYSFPRLTRLAFFHQNKERDWRLDSDPVTLAVHRRYLRASAG